MSGRLLAREEVDELLADHGGWARDGDGLRREVEFADFVEAFAFMTQVALISERLFHHPEWSNVYNRVQLRITDHDAGGLSTNDRQWVEDVDRLLA